MSVSVTSVIDMSTADRPARPEDIDEICGSLPETELGISWGDRPTWKVPRGDKGKGFLLYRAPGRTAIESTPFFTIDHFNGYAAVLVQQSRLGEISRQELVEVITDAWATKAPKKLVREHLGE